MHAGSGGGRERAVARGDGGNRVDWRCCGGVSPHWRRLPLGQPGSSRPWQPKPQRRPAAVRPMQVRSIFDSLAHIKVHFSHYFLYTRSLHTRLRRRRRRWRAALVPPKSRAAQAVGIAHRNLLYTKQFGTNVTSQINLGANKLSAIWARKGSMYCVCLYVALLNFQSNF